LKKNILKNIKEDEALSDSEMDEDSYKKYKELKEKDMGKIRDDI
jgi:hypothetical protein